MSDKKRGGRPKIREGQRKGEEVQEGERGTKKKKKIQKEEKRGREKKEKGGSENKERFDRSFSSLLSPFSFLHGTAGFSHGHPFHHMFKAYPLSIPCSAHFSTTFLAFSWWGLSFLI